MRMWMTDPTTMCRQHLLGEHVETHMFVGTISRGRSLAGFVSGGLVDTAQLAQRHDALAAEMVRRGYRHHSPLHYTDTLGLGQVDPEHSAAELRSRCPACAARQEGTAHA